VADTVNRRSYGPEAAEVQIAVPADTNQALGTVIQFAQRVRRLFVRNLGLFPVTLEVQQSPVTGGGAAFVTVTGTSTTIVAGGEAPIEFAGLVNDPVLRLFGSGTGGSSVLRVAIDDLDLLDNFRQTGTYGAG